MQMLQSTTGPEVLAMSPLRINSRIKAMYERHRYPGLRQKKIRGT